MRHDANKGVLTAYVQGWRDTFRFKGRVSRRCFWYFYLVHFVLSVVLILIDTMIPHPVPFLSLLMTYGSLLTIISIGVRRLHDIGRSGWWMLFLILPVIGGLILLVPHAVKGDPEPNQYGDPQPDTGPRQGMNNAIDDAHCTT